MSRIVTEDNLRNWRSWYETDFGPLLEVKSNQLPAFYIKPQRAKEWKTLGEPVLLADIDLGKFEYPISLDTTLTIVANDSGQLDAFLMYFELELGPTARLSTHPAQATSDNHWRSPAWVPDRPVPLRNGDYLQVACNYRSGNYSIQLTATGPVRP